MNLRHQESSEFNQGFTLRQLLLLTKDGEWGKGEASADSVEMVVIRGADFDSIRVGDLAGVPHRHIPSTVASRKMLQPNDIIIETAGGTQGRPTGRTVLLKHSLFGNSGHPITCASFSRFLRVDQELALPEYVYWYLQYLYQMGQMEVFQVQHTGVARFQFTKFAESTVVPLPRLETQRTIASILGALDDKIELNRRMNATLEAMARAIFQSWFVDFDPVRAKAEGQETGLPAEIAALFPDGFVESELGEIPGGWHVAKVKDFGDLAYGRPLKEQDRQLGNVPVYGSNGQIGWHNSALVAGPGIVVGRKGNPGIVTWAPSDFFCIDTTFYVIPAEDGPSLHYLYYALTQLDLGRLGADSAVPGLNRNHAYITKLLKPDVRILTAFESLTVPIFQQIYAHECQVRTLASIRNALLPKLISGQLRVPEAEKLLGEATA